MPGGIACAGAGVVSHGLLSTVRWAVGSSGSGCVGAVAGRDTNCNAKVGGFACEKKRHKSTVCMHMCMYMDMYMCMCMYM